MELRSFCFAATAAFIAVPGFSGEDARFYSRSDHEENVKRQVSMTPRTLEQLRGYGVTDSTELTLEYFFYTDTEEKAGGLVDDLRARGYLAAHRSAASHDATYVVTGWTTSLRMEEAVLVRWTEAMCELGYERDAEFDGWGTHPEQSSNQSP